MKKSYRLFALAALFALGVACWAGVGSEAQEPQKQDGPQVKKKKAEAGWAVLPIPKWEYKVTDFGGDDKAVEEELNKLGDEGWELVGTPTRTSGGGDGRVARSKVSLVFKRPKR